MCLELCLGEGRGPMIQYGEVELKPGTLGTLAREGRLSPLTQHALGHGR